MVRLAVRLAAAAAVGGLLVACAASRGPRDDASVPASGWSLPEPVGAAPGRVVLVSIAGLTPDLYLDASTPMPRLAGLARAGTAADAMRPVQPATVFPAHASLVTGRRPAEHGIVADRLIGDHGVRQVRYWHASRLTAPTLWERARAAGLGVVALDWPGTVGAAIGRLLPDLDAVRSEDTWLGLQKQTASPWVFDRVRASAPADAESRGSTWPDADQRDAIAISLACAIAAEPAPPQLWLLRLGAPDTPLRRDGPDSPAAREAFARADARLGQLLGCLERAGLLSSTALVVVGDRAVVPVHSRIEPNGVLARAGLIELASDGGIEDWTALVRSNGGSAFVYAKDEVAAVDARRALDEAAAGSRAFRVVPATELQALRADRQAWFGLEAAPGFRFGNAADTALVLPSVERGADGFLGPDGAGRPVGFVAWGPGLRPGVRVPELWAEDVAPTLAALLGVELGAPDGRTLVGLFRTAPPAEGRR